MHETTKLVGVSSMATRLLLVDMAGAFASRSGIDVAFTSMGGVDAVRKIQAGEPFDVAVLARDAIAILETSGHLLAGSSTDWAHSSAAIVAREGAADLAVDSEAALRRSALERRVAYSTGPSGTALLGLFERWGILEDMRDRLVQAPAGMPVASLVAEGHADLGIQQLSELRNVPGVRVLGPMPPGCDIVSIFSAAIGAKSARPSEARQFLAFLHSMHGAEIIRRHGMTPASELRS